jgi:hypothetical protein
LERRGFYLNQAMQFGKMFLPHLSTAKCDFTLPGDTVRCPHAKPRHTPAACAGQNRKGGSGG